MTIDMEHFRRQAYLFETYSEAADFAAALCEQLAKVESVEVKVFQRVVVEYEMDTVTLEEINFHSSKEYIVKLLPSKQYQASRTKVPPEYDSFYREEGDPPDSDENVEHNVLNFLKDNSFPGRDRDRFEPEDL